MFWKFKFDLDKLTFDDGSRWLENHTLIKKEQIIQKEWKMETKTFEIWKIILENCIC